MSPHSVGKASIQAAHLGTLAFTQVVCVVMETQKRFRTVNIYKHARSIEVNKMCLCKWTAHILLVI